MVPHSRIECRLYGAFAIRYALECFGNSALFAIANIAFESLCESPRVYV
ncbi:hypothetical protein [uncultured Chloroflexus sp.]|nr:hypothetical protein [uncultured Chloroflexus sp.]